MVWQATECLLSVAVRRACRKSLFDMLTCALLQTALPAYFSSTLITVSTGSGSCGLSPKDTNTMSG